MPDTYIILLSSGQVAIQQSVCPMFPPLIASVCTGGQTKLKTFK